MLQEFFRTLIPEPVSSDIDGQTDYLNLAGKSAGAVSSTFEEDLRREPSDGELNTVILGQEIGAVAVDNLLRCFLFRMNIEFVQYHHHSVFKIIRRPFPDFAIR